MQLKRKIINNLWAVGALLIAGFCISACDRNLDVQQAYDFRVETMPVRKDIKLNETIEIRCSLIEQGSFSDNRYTIRYFQSEGQGTLCLGKDGEAFIPNDRYLLPEKEFRLYYTSNSKARQTIDIYVENCFGKVQQLAFSFDNEN